MPALFRGNGSIRDGSLPRAVTSHVCEEAYPVDQLHREEPLLAVGEQLVEGDEIRVDEVGERSEFLFEPIEGLLTGPAKGFQGDPAAPLAIERLVDDAERAGPEPASQLETLCARKVFRPEAAQPILASPNTNLKFG